MAPDTSRRVRLAGAVAVIASCVLAPWAGTAAALGQSAGQQVDRDRVVFLRSGDGAPSAPER